MFFDSIYSATLYGKIVQHLKVYLLKLYSYHYVFLMPKAKVSFVRSYLQFSLETFVTIHTSGKDIVFTFYHEVISNMNSICKFLPIIVNFKVRNCLSIVPSNAALLAVVTSIRPVVVLKCFKVNYFNFFLFLLFGQRPRRGR